MAALYIVWIVGINILEIDAVLANELASLTLLTTIVSKTNQNYKALAAGEKLD